MNNHMQREMPILSNQPSPREVVDSQVSLCKTESQAIAMCFNLSGHTVDSLAEQLEVNKGTVSRVVRGKQPIPRRVSRIKFMQACGNLLPLQWEAAQAGYELVDRNLLAAISRRSA